jgi:hypothetical protein
MKANSPFRNSYRALIAFKSQLKSVNPTPKYPDLSRPRAEITPHPRAFTTSTSFKMKEAIVAKGPKVTIHDVPTPKPGPGQVLIKVVYSGSNPKDWKRPLYGEPHNSGDDIAGVVEAVGKNVVEFKAGDRVAAFHEMMAPHGSFAVYAVAWAYTTFHLPNNTTFEEVCIPSTLTIRKRFFDVGDRLRRFR